MKAAGINGDVAGKTVATRWDSGCVALEQEEGGAWSPELLGCRRKIIEDG